MERVRVDVLGLFIDSILKECKDKEIEKIGKLVGEKLIDDMLSSSLLQFSSSTPSSIAKDLSALFIERYFNCKPTVITKNALVIIDVHSSRKNIHFISAVISSIIHKLFSISSAACVRNSKIYVTVEQL